MTTPEMKVRDSIIKAGMIDAAVVDGNDNEEEGEGLEVKKVNMT
jgi:hypothetical protein